MHPMINIATQAARNASKIILRFMDQLERVEINLKNHNDVVTEVDRLAEQEIIAAIRKAYPNHAILAEESGQQQGEEYCWIIDPLDGTTNFVHGFPQFSISIAVKHHDQLVAAVIYDPIRNELFTASKGTGAQLNNRRIRVSQCKKFENALIGTGFPFREMHHLKPYIAIFEEIFPKTAGIRRAGSAALDLAYIAAGRLDGFWEAALKPWDMAAGILLIQEAGGMIGDFHGEQHYFDSGNLVAGNPKIYKQLIESIETALKEVK